MLLYFRTEVAVIDTIEYVVVVPSISAAQLACMHLLF